MSATTAVLRAGAARARPYSREVDLLLVIYLTVIVFSILYPESFFSWENLRAILNNLAADGIVAVGMMALMIAGVFDLSVGSTISMVGVLTGWLLMRQHWPVVPAVAAGLAVAALCGWVNGMWVAFARVNALITTLGTLGIYGGIAILVGGPSIVDLPGSFTRLGQTEIRGLQLPVWFMLALAGGAHYLLRHARGFRLLYYVGSNPKAARNSGIDVERVQVIAFTASGLIAGVAGLALAARFSTAVSNAGLGTELRVITAVILGGASLSGGKGTIAGALIGVLFIALIRSTLLMADVSPYWHSIVVGAILILAVLLDSIQTRARES
jgi:ribose transport system permease protein